MISGASEVVVAASLVAAEVTVVKPVVAVAVPDSVKVVTKVTVVSIAEVSVTVAKSVLKVSTLVVAVVEGRPVVVDRSGRHSGRALAGSSAAPRTAATETQRILKIKESNGSVVV